MHRESTFHTYIVGNAANGESLTHASTFTVNDNAFKNLNTFASSLDNFYVGADGVAWFEIRDVGTELFFFQSFNEIHGFSSFIKTFVSCFRYRGPPYKH